MDSFKILGNSSLKEAAPGTVAPAGNTENKDAAGADATGNDAAANTGNTDAGAADTGTADTGADSQESGEPSSEGTTNSAGFTEEQLSNTDETRTIYRNSDGKPLVIQPDGNGNWVDFDGNTYSFANDQDVYTEDGTSYYWHGEAADVYYMPVQ